VFCGGFLDVVLSQRFPALYWEKDILHYWGDGNQPLDHTAISDVALFAAAAATDPDTTGRPLQVAGNTLTAKELHRVLERASGKTLEARSLGILDQLRKTTHDTPRSRP